MRRMLGIALAAAALAAPNSPPAAEESAAAPRTARLEGTASLDRHHRVVGAAVVVRGGTGAPLLWLTTTDDKGFFVLDRLPEGTYRIEVRREGLPPVVKDKVEVRFPFRAVVEVTLSSETKVASTRSGAEPQAGSPVRLSGTVTVRGAGRLAEVRVRLVRGDGTADPRSALTRPDGTFEIADLPAGVWRVEVLGAGYLPVRADLEIAEDATVEAVLVPQPANYVAPALDLLPEEEPIPPAGL